MKRLSVAQAASLMAVPLALLATGLPTAAASDDIPRSDAAVFSMDALSDGDVTDVSGVSARSAKDEPMEAQGFSVMRAASGATAVVDTSMEGQGVIVAYGATFVDLSWKAYSPDARYVILRDGAQVAALDAGVNSFRDLQVEPGAEYDYQVMPVLPQEGDPQARLWGVKASVPESGSLAEMEQHAATQASTAAAARTTTLSWITFIPQKKINAPATGCDYGSGYQFGGDGRTVFDWKSSKYRTALHAVVTWSSKKVVGGVGIGATTVYKKSTGRKVATKTGSASNMSVKKLGAGANSVDVRMVTHAGNPYCRGLGGVKGAIDGALTIQLTKSGNYTIRSGKHRLMPNHHIYIYDGGRVTNVYKRKYANAACLIGSIACQEADLTGRRGSF
ncbi:hypothetical protein ACFYO0_28855 [Streptomyces sp. NPDC006365]|uniref:hypothetical protein n=1 Tax=Streptomyces sp. NPDC006365 TaxID=3364744 RepID=UPI0036BD019E